MATVKANALHSFPAGGKKAGDAHTVTNMIASGKPAVMGTIPTPGLATLTINGAVVGPFDLTRDGPNEIIARMNSGKIPGFLASIDRDFHLQLDGVSAIGGDTNLRQLLGSG